MYLIWCLLASTFCLADPKVYMGEAQRAFLDWAFLHRQELGTAGALKMSAAPKRPKGKKTQGLTLKDHKIILWPWWDEKKREWLVVVEDAVGGRGWRQMVTLRPANDEDWFETMTIMIRMRMMLGNMIMMMMMMIRMVMIDILWWSVCVFVCHQKSSLPPWSLL